MQNASLWSLRLGFSNKEAQEIQKLGIEGFLQKSFTATFDNKEPECLKDDPKSLSELKEYRKTLKNSSSDETKKALKKQLRNAFELKKWWLDKMETDAYPLREKMVCFWHNHFVSSSQKVKVNYWLFQNNQVFRAHAFGNFKQLTKDIIQSNAMVRYLDNVDNRKGKINENLSRELLELFTLGIGNYTEEDIKNGAKALAGLGLGEDKATYRKIFQDDDEITYLGKKGTFKANELVDIIFEHKAIPYLLTRKILKWFIYDNPSEELVIYYGDYFRKVNFEMQPLLLKIFTEEYEKNNAGSKIKDPLTYILQVKKELNITEVDNTIVAFFLMQQGMDLFNQLNVKGWEGGRSWLTSQLFLQRNNVADLFCNGKNISQKSFKNAEDKPNIELENIQIQLDWNKNGNNTKIIQELSDRLLFKVDENLQKDFENVLKYDFDSKSEGADNAVLRLFNFMIKTPEFQLI